MAKLYNKSGGILTVRLVDGSTASLRPRAFTEVPDNQARSGDVLAKERKGLLKVIMSPSKKSPVMEEKPSSVVLSEEPKVFPASRASEESEEEESDKPKEEETPSEQPPEEKSSKSSRRGRRRKKRS